MLKKGVQYRAPINQTLRGELAVTQAVEPGFNLARGEYLDRTRPEGFTEALQFPFYVGQVTFSETGTFSGLQVTFD